MDSILEPPVDASVAPHTSISGPVKLLASLVLSPPVCACVWRPLARRPSGVRLARCRNPLRWPLSDYE